MDCDVGLPVDGDLREQVPVARERLEVGRALDGAVLDPVERGELRRGRARAACRRSPRTLRARPVRPAAGTRRCPLRRCSARSGGPAIRRGEAPRGRSNRGGERGRRARSTSGDPWRSRRRSRTRRPRRSRSRRGSRGTGRRSATGLEEALLVADGHRGGRVDEIARGVQRGRARPAAPARSVHSGPPARPRSRGPPRRSPGARRMPTRRRPSFPAGPIVSASAKATGAARSTRPALRVGSFQSP